MLLPRFIVILLAWVLVQVAAAPVSRPASPENESSSKDGEGDFPIHAYKHGDIVGVRPSEYERNPPPGIDIHPGVIVDGPDRQGKYKVAMISKRLPWHPPQANLQGFHPQADIYGNVALNAPKKVRPKGMKPWMSNATKQPAAPMDAEGLEKLKAAMEPHQRWRRPPPEQRTQGAVGSQGQPGNPKGDNPKKARHPNAPPSGTMHPGSSNPHNLPPHPGPNRPHANNPSFHPGPPAHHDHDYSARHPQLPPPNFHAGPSRGYPNNPLHPGPTAHNDYAAHHAQPPPMHGPGSHSTADRYLYPHTAGSSSYGQSNSYQTVPRLPSSNHIPSSHHSARGPSVQFPTPHHYEANPRFSPAMYEQPAFHAPHPGPAGNVHVAAHVPQHLGGTASYPTHLRPAPPHGVPAPGPHYNPNAHGVHYAPAPGPYHPTMRPGHPPYHGTVPNNPPHRGARR